MPWTALKAMHFGAYGAMACYFPNLRKYVNHNRQVRLKAFVGENSQTVYELTLKFGPKALSRYALGLSIKECVPNGETEDWFTIDFGERRMEIQLK